MAAQSESLSPEAIAIGYVTEHGVLIRLYQQRPYCRGAAWARQALPVLEKLTELAYAPKLDVEAFNALADSLPKPPSIETCWLPALN